MPFNGSGTFVPPSSPTYPAVDGTTILASQFNNALSDVYTGLSTCLTRDGQGVPSANLPMNSYKHTGAGNASAAGQYLVYGQTSAQLATLSLTATAANLTSTSTDAGETTIGNSTIDGSDHRRIVLRSGGALSTARGAFLTLMGNEYASVGGQALLAASEINLDGAVDLNGDLDVSGTITGNGSLLTTLSATELASGTVATARLGSGAASASTVLLGNSTWSSNIAALNVGGQAIGYLNLPVISGSWAAGQCRKESAGVTLATTDMAAGRIMSFYNDSASSVTLTQGAGVTMRLGGTTTTGNRTVAPRGLVTVWCSTATEAIITGHVS